MTKHKVYLLVLSCHIENEAVFEKLFEKQKKRCTICVTKFDFNRL